MYPLKWNNALRSIYFPSTFLHRTRITYRFSIEGPYSNDIILHARTGEIAIEISSGRVLLIDSKTLCSRIPRADFRSILSLGVRRFIDISDFNNIIILIHEKFVINHKRKRVSESERIVIAGFADLSLRVIYKNCD